MKLLCNPFDFWFRKLKSAHKGKKLSNPGRKSDMMNSWLDKLMSIYIFIKKQLDNDLDSHYFSRIYTSQAKLLVFVFTSPQRKSALRQMHGTYSNAQSFLLNKNSLK